LLIALIPMITVLPYGYGADFCLLLIALCSFVGALSIMSLRDSFMIDRSALYPPYSMKALWWSELIEISIQDISRKVGCPRFFLVLHTKRDRKIRLELRRFEKDSLLTLAAAIERYAPSCRNLSLLAELSRFFDYEHGDLPTISYTQLWEYIANNRFELSAFTPLAPGTHLQQARLRITKQLSAGGFSAVYLVEDDEQEQRVLKEFVLPFGIDTDTRTKALEHFEREARLLVKLNHAQIAHVYDHFVEGGRHYLLLEFIDGLNLRNYIATNGAQNEHLVGSWAIALAKILSYLHNQEPPVIHRDISPDNIVIRTDGTPFLIDFGAANEFVGSATGTLIGKHAYMAPEQIRGKAEPVSDIYSLGATLYFCLTGLDPEPLRSVSPKQMLSCISAQFDELIRSCTALETSLRCRSAQDIIDRLSHLSLGSDASKERSLMPS